MSDDSQLDRRSWLALVAAVALVTFVVGVGLTVADDRSPSAPPVNVTATGEDPTDGGCFVDLTADPSRLDAGDRIVVEIGHYANVFDERTQYWGEAEPGSQVRAYAVALDREDGRARTLVDGYLNADCELVSVGGEAE